jgi:hypothetical protein
LGDLGWTIRERLSASVVAVLLALAGLGTGVAGIVIALDAKDKAEEATATAPVTTAPPEGLDPEVSARVDELNKRVAAIEESVSRLRTEFGETTTPETTTTPEPPELPEGLPEIPGVGAPEREAPPKP